MEPSRAGTPRLQHLTAGQRPPAGARRQTGGGGTNQSKGEGEEKVAHTKIRRRGSPPAGPPATAGAGIATDGAYRRNWIGTEGRL
jgi:hypothetical protein